MGATLRIEIDFNLNQASATVVKTNAKDRKILEDVLCEFIHDQMGRGEDRKEVEEEDVYKIVIDLDFKDDSFHVSSNSGKSSTTTGIVAWILTNIDSIRVVDMDGADLPLVCKEESVAMG